MYAPRFCLRSFGALDPAAREAVLFLLFEALIGANCAHLARNPATPSLYESGIRYEEEPLGREDWQDIPDTIARGVGDCEDLACWRIAELRVRHAEHATPYLKRDQRESHVLYHVAVRRLDGSLEDPSRVLGMR